MRKESLLFSQRSFAKQNRAKKPKRNIPIFIGTGLLAFFVALIFLAWPSAPLLAAGAIPTAENVAQAGGLPMVSLTVFLVGLLRIFFGLLGLIAVLLLIYGGFVWMTSAGDPGKVDKAKKIIYNTIIGLIIIFSAFAITTFLLSWLQNNFPGPTPGPISCAGCFNDPSRSAIGGGPIESVYPKPNQVNVPINTRIAVTFKENIDPGSICDLSASGGTYCDGEAMKNVSICLSSATSTSCSTDTEFDSAAFAGTTVIQANPTDFRTYVFEPNKYLGNEDEINRVFLVKLQNGILARATAKSIFTGFRTDYYNWSFKTNGRLDLTPPEIQKFEIYPFPDLDGMADVYDIASQAAAGSATITLNSNPNFAVPIKINNKFYLDAPFAGNDRPELGQDGGPASSPGFHFYITASSGFNVSSTAAIEPIRFTVSGGGDYVTFNNFAHVANVLGINYQTTGACLGQTGCLLLQGRRTVPTGAGLIFEATGDLDPGTAWKFTVAPAQAGDYLTLINSSSTVANFLFVTSTDNRQVIIKQAVAADGRTIITTVFQTVPATDNRNATAQNLVTAINSFNPAARLVRASTTNPATPYSVILFSINSGTNQLGLTQSPGSTGLALDTGGFAGQARMLNWLVNGVKDPYNNSVFRITFTEPITPINLDSSIQITINGVPVIASTTFTNQYRSVELMGKYPCGINACGRQMYCWLDPNTGGVSSSPANILVKANTLRFCASGTEKDLANDWCKNWGGTCSSTFDNARCKLATGLYFPQASTTINGVIDMANNSFNGNFNSANTTKGAASGNAEGPFGSGSGHSGLTNPYNLNSSAHMDGAKQPPQPTFSADNSQGDDFFWSFFVSSQVDKTAPLITSIKPVGDQAYGLGIDETFHDPIEFIFNTLMRLATLKPGWGYADSKDAPAWSLRYLVLKTVTGGANPVGYWASSKDIDQDNDGLADYTIAYLEHNPFDLSVTYGPLGGSGVESITQNCFLPGNGPQNAGDPTTSTVPTTLVSNNCRYSTSSNNTTTTGCVTDLAIPDINRVTSTNPASYGYLNCKDIDGTVPCAANKFCLVHYATSKTDASSSWVITKDFPEVLNPNTGATGCCFGKCYNP